MAAHAGTWRCIMRLYRPPVIGPRAAGVTLVVLGVMVFVLLGLFSPAPAGSQGISPDDTLPGGCDPLVSRDAGQGASGLDPEESACDSRLTAQRGESGTMVVQELGDGAVEKRFFALDPATLGGETQYGGQRRSGRHGVIPSSSGRRRTYRSAERGKLATPKFNVSPQ